MSFKELDGKLVFEKIFVFVKCQVLLEIVDWIVVFKLLGVYQEKEYCCYYLIGDMIVYIVGFIGVDDKGLEGVELVFQSSLFGYFGSCSVIKDWCGQIVEDVGVLKLFMDGKDVWLVFDLKI